MRQEQRAAQGTTTAWMWTSEGGSHLGKDSQTLLWQEPAAVFSTDV